MLLWILFILAYSMALSQVRHVAHDPWLLQRAYDAMLIIMLATPLPDDTSVKKFLLPYLAALMSAYLFGLVTLMVAQAFEVPMCRDEAFNDVMVCGIWVTIGWNEFVDFFKTFNHDHLARE